MLRLAFAVAVALLALCVVAPASAGVTRFPGGVLIGDINDSPSTTPGDDDLYVKGTFEVDGASDLDSTLNVEGAVTLQSTIAINGNATIGNASTDSHTINGDTTVAGALTIGNDGAPFIVKNASATCFAITTNGTPADGDVILTFTNGDAGTMKITADDGFGGFVIDKVIDVPDIETATVSARDGSLAITLTDSTGAISCAAGFDVVGASTLDGNVTLGDAVTDVITCTGGLVIAASSTCPYQATTPVGAVWMTATSGNPGENEWVSDGAAGTEAVQNSELYVFTQSHWVPVWASINP